MGTQDLRGFLPLLAGAADSSAGVPADLLGVLPFLEGAPLFFFFTGTLGGGLFVLSTIIAGLGCALAFGPLVFLARARLLLQVQVFVQSPAWNQQLPPSK